MSADLVAFHGRSLIDTAEVSGAVWLRHYGYAAQRWPVSELAPVSPEERRRLLSKKKIWLLDYFVPANPGGNNASLFCCDLEGFSERSLHTKARNQTKKALENEALQFEELDDFEAHKAELAALYRKDLHRSHPELRVGVEDCLRMVEGFKNPAVRIYAVFHNGRIVSFARIVLHPERGEGHLDLLKTDYEQRKVNPNNLLIFGMCSRLGCEIRRLYFGATSIEHLKKIDHFKENMGFDRIPVARVIDVHPLVRFVPFRVLPRLLQVAADFGLVARHRAAKSRHLCTYLD